MFANLTLMKETEKEKERRKKREGYTLETSRGSKRTFGSKSRKRRDTRDRYYRGKSVIRFLFAATGIRIIESTQSVIVGNATRFASHLPRTCRIIIFHESDPPPRHIRQK